MTRSYSQKLSAVQNSAKRRQAEHLEMFMEDPKKCHQNTLSRREKQEWALVKKEERRDLGLVDGLRFETEEESAEYLRKREEESAAHRPDRKGQTTKKRKSFSEKAQFKERNSDYEKQKEMVNGMSRDKAKRLVTAMRNKYGGSVWPKDVCKLFRLLQLKACTVGAGE